MIKVSKRYIRRLAPVALAFALISALAPTTADAATLTSVSVTPADSTPAASTTWSIDVSSATSGSNSVKCLLVYVDASAAFDTSSAAAVMTGNPGGATWFTGGTWTSSAATFGSTSAYKFLSTGGMTVDGGGAFTVSITNPAAGTYYVKVATFGNTDCATSPIDDGTSAVAITANTTVSVTVDPTFTFSVTGLTSGTVCNGITSTLDASGMTNAVTFGHLAAGARAMGTQRLRVTTNAGGGYVVNLHSTAASANVMKGSGAHVITDSGSVALPAAGNDFFGYSTDSTTAAVTSGQLRTVPTNAGNNVVGNGSAGTNVDNCVVYGVGASASTPADSYSSTMVYTAIPTF